MENDHYFSAKPHSSAEQRSMRVTLQGRTIPVVTAPGIFSPSRLDTGTEVLLGALPALPPSGAILDLGCGWGPLALSAAFNSPRAEIWAVDVNERALELTAKNAKVNSLSNIHAALPEEVPDELMFSAIVSNPPIRVGKEHLHNILRHWLPRLKAGADAWLVVQKNLGSDSLQRWLEFTLGSDYRVLRFATSKGFRVLRVTKRNGSDHS